MCRGLAAVLAFGSLALGPLADPVLAGTASGRPAQFTAAAGERNDLSVDAGSGGAVRFSDAGAPVNATLPWCTPFPLGQALCDPDGDPRDTDGGGVSVDLGDGGDRTVIRFIPGTGLHPGAIRVAAGSGDDLVENVASGAIRFDGGDGNDTLTTGPAATALLLGGAGADVLSAPSGCCSLVAYSDHDATGVRVTLDRTANDGAAGEGDDVRTSGVAGSPGPDVITGDSGANTLSGLGGADVLAGGGGDDTIDATAQGAPGADEADTVGCGAGSDDVAADAIDTIGLDCERIRVGAPVGPELVLDLGAGRAGRDGTVRVTVRVKFPNPDNALASRSTLRLVDARGRAVSSAAQVHLGGQASVARVRVRLNRATRRRLARSRSRAIAVIAQRTSRSADPELAGAGYERFNVAATIRRAR